ncbi:YjcQ family protein [Priestia sp. D51]
MDRKKLALEILKRIRDKQPMTTKELGVDLQFLAEVSEMVRDEGLAKNIHVTRGGQGNKALHISLSSAIITMAGLNYIEENDVQPSEENDSKPKIQVCVIPWPEGKTVAEVEENPPTVSDAERFLENPNHEIIAVECGKMLFFTKEWYTVTIQYTEKVSQEV